MSADSTDAHGYEDLAIGYFPVHMDFDDGVKRVVCDWWQECTQGEPERAWAYIFREGLISEDETCTWAEELWGSEDHGDQRDEEEYEEEGRAE